MSFDSAAARATLKKMREEQDRSPGATIRLIEPLLESYAHRMGDEVWVLYEQGCIAALDCNRPDLFKVYYDALERKFGRESVRVGLLEGQKLESEGRWADASKRYEDLLKIEPTNARVMKREVAMCVAQQDIAGAIKKMGKYLDKFAADAEGWTELSNLYLRDSRFGAAKFCLEELILSHPYNYLFHLRYAEILYTLGDAASLTLCKKHYAHAVHLNPKSARALYGLLMVTKKMSLNGDKETSALAKRSAEMLTEVYNGKSTAPLLTKMLAELDIKK